jgi:hypothetical protein
MYSGVMLYLMSSATQFVVHVLLIAVNVVCCVTVNDVHCLLLSMLFAVL